MLSPLPQFKRWPHLLALTLLVWLGAGCSSTPWENTPLDPSQLTFADDLNVELSRMEQIEPGLYSEDISLGSGRAAERGSRVWIHYITWLPDGTLVDASVGGPPMSFRLGEGEVIRGWERAIPGMQVGGNRRLVIRPGLAYGSRGTAKVPPGATLVFQVELVDAYR